tara:strand:+ start:261 stop:506 length:246 start_codon:yes stop_codon:yes gene_type:complete
MPSLDFIYDITEKLDEEELDYLVLAIREGRHEDKVDVFFNVKKASEGVLSSSLDRIKEIIAERDDDSEPYKPKAKRKRKKK